jgi:uncharacterized protein (DUF433 family)
MKSRIAISPEILHGKPRVRGTRIAVSMVLELLAEGYSPSVIRRRFYPDLTLEDIYACIDFARHVVASAAKQSPGWRGDCFHAGAFPRRAELIRAHDPPA